MCNFVMKCIALCNFSVEFYFILIYFILFSFHLFDINLLF